MTVINNIEKLTDLLLRQKAITATQSEHIRRAWEQRGRHRRRSEKEKIPKLPIPFIAALNFTAGGKPLDEEAITRAVAREFGLPFRRIDPLELDGNIVAGTITRPFALWHMVVPLEKTEGALTVAVADPETGEALEQIKKLSGLDINRVIAARSDIERIINQFYGFRATMREAEKGVSAGAALSDLEQLSRLKSEEEISSSDKHIQNAVELILHYALANRASDIHIEPKREETVVRMRIDGALNETQRIPRAVHGAVLSRIKILARLDVSEKRRPQDGRIKVQKEGKESEMRVSILPTVFGEKAVIRIFDAEMALRGLGALGLYPEELERYQRFLARPHGIILVTGPTGSGKTNTLYSSLKYIESPDRNIVTIEDPVEMVVPEFNQVAVQPVIEFTFAAALRAILRQDPDVIMIGEIRDHETAQNAVQAALTGHLVLSTLHTNDTVSSLTRLYDIGIEPYLVKSSLIGVVAQRLVRMICPRCIADIEHTADELKSFGLSASGPVRLKKGTGCDHCRSTGYHGRTGVHEVLEVSNDIRQLIDGKTPDTAIKEMARKSGMRTLKENAARKMAEGITTFEEVLRLTAV
ncbi:MAG: type II/IV secretion system protein [Nitrospinae bacterium]|nr:type II/IV secretion system protein [Nitrospinota bacterium]